MERYRLFIFPESCSSGNCNLILNHNPSVLLQLRTVNILTQAMKITFLLLVILPLGLFAQWNPVYIPGANLSCMEVIDEDTLVAATWSGGRIHRASDGGQSWYPYQTEFSSSWFNDIHFPTKEIGYACGGTAFGNHTNVIIKSQDAGHTWDSITSNDFTGYNLTNIHFLNRDTGFVSGENGLLLRTLDGGLTFNTIETPGIETVSEIHYPLEDVGLFATANQIAASTQVYHIYSTTDLGSSWTIVYSDTMHNTNGINHRMINEMYFSDPATGYAVGGNGLFLKTYYYGSSWLNGSISPGTNLTTVHFNSADIGYVNNAGGIYKTSDAGTNWSAQNITMLSIIHSIKFANDTLGYALGEAGIYKTINSGQLNNMTQLNHEAGPSFYPNPFSDQANMDITLPDAEHAVLSLFDTQGRLVQVQSEFHENKLTIYRGSLKPGMYIYRFRNSKQDILSGKLLVK